MRLCVYRQLIGARAEAFKHANEIVMAIARGTGLVTNYFSEQKIIDEVQGMRVSQRIDDFLFDRR
jgi:hypothetical protein